MNCNFDRFPFLVIFAILTRFSFLGPRRANQCEIFRTEQDNEQYMQTVTEDPHPIVDHGDYRTADHTYNEMFWIHGPRQMNFMF